MVTTFSIATDEQWKDKNGEKVQKTTWHNIVCWKKLAEIAGNYLKKGSQVFIEGKIDNRSYEDKDGNKRYISEIVASTMTMLGGKSSGGEKAAEQRQATPRDDASFDDPDSVPF
jgi:single-strand DNA-binding protein